MRKRLMWAALILTGAIIAICPAMARLYQERVSALPPGMERRESRLVRIWLLGESMGADSWLKTQAAAYEKKTGHVRIYLRRAEVSELIQVDAAMPDGILFTPGAAAGAQRQLLPLAGEWPIHPEVLRAGSWQGETCALPLCLGGYTLVTAEEPKTETLQAAPGLPFMLAASLPGERLILAKSSVSLTQNQVYDAFAREQCGRAVITLNQLKAFEGLRGAGRGFAYQAEGFPLAATDRYLAGAVTGGKNSADALRFFQWLLGEEAQRALMSAGLFSVNPAVDLYGPEMAVWDTQETGFQQTPVLPNALAFDQGQMAALGRSALQLGEDPSRLMESVR